MSSDIRRCPCPVSCVLSVALGLLVYLTLIANAHRDFGSTELHSYSTAPWLESTSTNSELRLSDNLSTQVPYACLGKYGLKALLAIAFESVYVFPFYLRSNDICRGRIKTVSIS